MIRRLEIRNLKRFKQFECALAEHLVIVGPNNCGKTTLLQAIAFWSEIALHWARYNPDLAATKMYGMSLTWRAPGSRLVAAASEPSFKEAFDLGYVLCQSIYHPRQRPDFRTEALNLLLEPANYHMQVPRNRDCYSRCYPARQFHYAPPVVVAVSCL